MKTTRIFEPGDRYKYDFNLCSIKKGYAQVDTSQDASYFGTWANPFKLKIVTYCEGDVTINDCENEKEFKDEMMRAKKFYDEQGGRGFLGIDPGFDDKLKDQFVSIGLGDLLH